MTDYTKTREPTNFKRTFGKYTGIKYEFSALLTALQWTTVGALLTVLTPSFKASQQWSLSRRLLLSLTVEVATSCSVTWKLERKQLYFSFPLLNLPELPIWLTPYHYRKCVHFNWTTYQGELYFSYTIYSFLCLHMCVKDALWKIPCT